MSHHELVDKDGVRLQADKCPTCIFRPGNPMRLNPGRVKDMIDECKDSQGPIVCHDTLDLDRQAICRGYWDSHRADVGLLQVAERMGFVKEITKGAS